MSILSIGMSGEKSFFKSIVTFWDIYIKSNEGLRAGGGARQRWANRLMERE